MNSVKYLICSLMIAFLCGACSNDEYRNLIPKNAKAVMAVNLEQLFQDFEMSKRVKDKVHSICEIIISGSDADFIMDLLEGNENSGIDFEEPFFLFKAPENFYGATFKVDDIDDLDELFNMLHRQNLCKKPTEKDDNKWTALLDDISVVYNDDFLSIMYSENFVETKNNQKHLLNIEEDNSFAATEKFKKMQEKEGPVKFILNIDAFVDYTDDNYGKILENIQAFLPQGTRPVDVNIVGDINTNKGEVELNFELFSLNKKTRKILEKEDDKFKKINGDFIGAPNDFACWLGMGIEGEDLVMRLKQFDNINQYLIKLGMAIDIENILKAVKGDVAVLLPGAVVNNEQFGFVMNAKLKNSDFLKSVNWWKDQMVDYRISMDEVSKNNFVLKADSIQLNWGVDNNNLFFASGNSFFKSAFTENSDKLDEVEKDIKNSVIYAYINAEVFVDKIGANANKYAGLLEYVEIKAKDYRNYSVTLVTKDKEKSIWQILSDII